MLSSNHYFPPFSEAEYKRRHSVLAEEMKKAEIDCLVVYGAVVLGGSDTGQINAQYLSNYAGVGCSYVVFPADDDPTLHLSVPLHAENAKDIGYIQDVRGGAHLELTICQRLKELKIGKGRIGIVGANVKHFLPCTIPYEHHMCIQKTFPEAELCDVSEWYEAIRSIKSDEEIVLMEKAAELNDLCHEEMFQATRPGMSHADLRRIVEEITFKHKGNYCMMHLSSWPNGQPHLPYPDFWPTDRAVENDHVLMSEMPVGYGMYSTKIMGTYFTGEPTSEYRNMFELAASVHKQVIDELKPGMKGSDVGKFMGAFREAGLAASHMISGWSNYNSLPFVGQTDPNALGGEVQSHLDYEFKPGLCVQVMSYPIMPGFSGGLWVGSTCVFTENGLRELNKYPVRELRVING